jgi:hypothetical protein
MGSLTLLVLLPVSVYYHSEMGSTPKDWVPELTFFVCATVSIVFGLGKAVELRGLRIVSRILVGVLGAIIVSWALFYIGLLVWLEFS